jgi:hypothetical protein
MPLTLLDYGRPSPFGETLGRSRNLAWPVNVYRVTFPKLSEDNGGLNPFERVLLKVIDAGGARETEALARETSIPVDLVQCVLLRLRDKAFINEHNEIVEQTRQDWRNKVEEPPAYITALLFRELADGKILPYLHVLNDDNPLKKKEGEERFFWRIRLDKAHTKRLPITSDVIAALRAMQKRSRAFGNEKSLPAAQQITIASDPEQYHLDCPIAIQKSDSEFRIADAFGNGFSLILEHAFSRLLEQDKSLSDWLMNWKKGLSNPKQDKQDTLPEEPYENEANWGRYRNLVSNLRLRQNTPHRSIEQIHAALEWALFYSCVRRPYDTAVNQLRLTNQSEHPNLLAAAAREVGLNPPEYGFRPVWGGKLDGFVNGKAEMGTVLSIALLMGGSDDSHPLRRVAARYDDFIIRILDIKQKRDAQAHGQGKVQRAERELPEEAFMREIVTVLLPAIRFSDSPVAEADKDAVADALLDARTSIQNEFGFGLFNRLGTNLQDRLIHAERFWLSCEDGDDALVFACEVYAALQSAFRRSLSGVLPPDIKDSEFPIRAQENASLHGLGQLPECLRTVKQSAIRQTLQGADQTLGACAMTFLLVSSAETLRSVADIQPSFLSDVENIDTRRGHGNQPLPLPKADIGGLRKSALSTIKTLQEA